MFQSRWDGANNTDSPIQYSYGTFKAFLNYIYTKECGDSEDEWAKIDWQEYYGHLELKTRCEAYLSAVEVDLSSDDDSSWDEGYNSSSEEEGLWDDDD